MVVNGWGGAEAVVALEKFGATEMEGEGFVEEEWRRRACDLESKQKFSLSVVVRAKKEGARAAVKGPEYICCRSANFSHHSPGMTPYFNLVSALQGYVKFPPSALHISIDILAIGTRKRINRETTVHCSAASERIRR
jgi:hypothetical protein